MKLVLDDDEVEELKISDIIGRSADKGLVVQRDKFGKSVSTRYDELTKEIIASDAITIGSRKAAHLHDVSTQTPHAYRNGEQMNEETRNNVLTMKHNIADKAITKLMDTLDLFDPNGIEKQVDIARAASQMAGVVEKVSNFGKSEGGNVHLHLYAPEQKKLKSYDIIDV